MWISNDVLIGYLRDSHASTTDRLDLLLSFARKELCLDNDGLLGEQTLAKDLVVSLGHQKGSKYHEMGKKSTNKRR